ncbi:MAG TPA: bile acid:sodium symporter [Phycisphaerae bacterium]|nr:bile acid:sodium symporter [Phycisphaerae bacterium]
MSLERITNLLVTITLIEMMLAIGLGVTFAELGAVARNRGLLLRAALANYVCVPAFTVALLFLFHAQPMVAAGFLILAVCPGAPFGPACTALARGNVSTAVGTMVFLAGSSALLAPLMLRFLLPLMGGNQPLQVDAAGMVTALFATQLAPLMIGLAVRHGWPSVAQKVKSPSDKLSAILSLVTLGFLLVIQFPALKEIRLVGFGGMGILLIASLASGWILGGPGRADRSALALTTSLRNVGVGLVIATRTFADTPAVLAVAAYGIVEIIGSVLVALWWRR